MHAIEGERGGEVGVERLNDYVRVKAATASFLRSLSRVHFVQNTNVLRQTADRTTEDIACGVEGVSLATERERERKRERIRMNESSIVSEEWKLK